MSDLEILNHRLTEAREARKAAVSLLNEQSKELTTVQTKLEALGSLVASTPYPIMQFDQQGAIHFSNPAAIKLWGHDVIPGALLQNAFPFMKDVNFSNLIGSNERFQLLARKRDEFFRFVFNGDASTGLASLYCLDVTEYEREKIELRKAHQESEELLTSLSSVLIGVDRGGEIILWNKTAEKLFGIKEVDVLGKPLADCGIDWDLERILKLVHACQEYVTFYEDKIRFRRLDGMVGTLEVVLTPVAKNHQRRAGVFLLARDITDFALMEGTASTPSDFEAMVASWTNALSGPVQQVSENLLFLENAVRQISEVVEKNLALLSASSKEDALRQHLLELGETIRATNIEDVLHELPRAVEETIEQVSKVGDFLSRPKTKEKVA